MRRMVSLFSSEPVFSAISIIVMMQPGLVDVSDVLAVLLRISLLCTMGGDRDPTILRLFTRNPIIADDVVV